MSLFVSAIVAAGQDDLSLDFSLGLYASNSLVLSRQPADGQGIMVSSDDDDPGEQLQSVLWGHATVVLLSTHREYVLDVSHVSASELLAARAMLSRMNHDGVVTLE